MEDFTKIVDERNLLAETLATLLTYLLALDWNKKYSVDELVSLSQKFIQHPHEVCKIGDIVKVKVLINYIFVLRNYILLKEYRADHY